MWRRLRGDQDGGVEDMELTFPHKNKMGVRESDYLTINYSLNDT